MDHALQTTWETYVASWKAPTPAEKQALFAASLDEHCTYTDPLGVASGWEALAQTMQGLHQQIPGAYFVTERFSSHHNRCMAQWKMHGGNGAVIGEGVSFGEYNGQGKLIAMTGFYDTPLNLVPRMFYLHRIQRGIDFIEAHLDTDIALSEVAQAAGLSQWHFQRIFKALTNETLKTYIRSRRFAKALDQLLNTRLGILDIALAAGYDTQESFTRAFKACFELTPNQYRKFGRRSLFVKKIQFDEDYMRQLDRNLSLTPDIRERPPLQLVGMATHFYGADSDKDNLGQKLPPLWAGFMPRLAEIPHRVPGVCYGVVSQTASTSDLLLYHAAIEVSHAGALPEGMVHFEVPAARYATFEHRGAPENVNHTVNYIYANWLSGAEQRHSGGADLEIYGPGYQGGSDASVMHYAVPVVG